MDDSTELKKIGILQTGLLGGSLGETHGEYPEMFQNMLGQDMFTYVVYPVVNNIFPENPLECDGWIITGSKHGVYEDHTWIAPLEDFIRDLYSAKHPTIGICFGHQIMAQAMGGTVEKYADGWAVGMQGYTDVPSGETIRIRAFHQDQVTTAPEGTEVILTSDFCKYAGLKYSDTFQSLQPHPEHLASFSTDLIKDRRGNLLSFEVADEALGAENTPNNHKKIAEWMTQILS